MPLANHFEKIGIGKDGGIYFIFAKSEIDEICYLTEQGDFTFNKKLRGEIDSFETIKEIFIDMFNDEKTMQELNLMFSF